MTEHLFRMPALGADMTEGAVLEWLVGPGDRVHRGDILAVIKTDKADVEAEAFDDGVIGNLLVAVGPDMLAIGTPLATIVDETSEAVAPPVVQTPPVPVEAPPPVADAEPVHLMAPPVPSERVAASPLARRRARELGVDLVSLAAERAGRPIAAADVEQAVIQTPKPAQPVDQATAMRRAIGNLMARSKREIPHYYLEEDIELGHTLAWLAHHNESVPVDQRVLPAALLYKAVALSVHAYPVLNGHWINDGFAPSRGVHLGVAIAMRGGGLVAPAIHDADQLSLVELMARLRDLTGRVRGGRLRASEMTDGTITVTNLGDQGVRVVHGVIFPPQVALVGFGKVTDRVWDADGGLGIRPVVTATLAADHRATDGHLGARFLNDVARRLHHPEEL